MRHKWCDALGISRAIPNQSVCSNHFSPGCYNFSNSRKMLKSFAVPSLCLKKKRIYNTCQISDFTSFDFGTPKRSSKNLKVVKNTLGKKIASMNDMFSILKQKSLITEFIADNMKVGIGSDILDKCIQRGLEGKKQEYCNTLKQFVVTLQYYSPKAYTYVRKRFNNLLPHPRTLRRWFMVVDGKPGFTQLLMRCVLGSKLKLAYFLIDGLGGKERANLLQENPRAFIISKNDEKLFIFLDPAHMLKLIRNAWEHRSVIKNANGEIIDWVYIKKLYELEREQGLRAGTRLTKRHIKFHNEKMNIWLAAQTLSQSISDALTYLKNTNEDFKRAGPTAEFISFINNAFDTLNSRSRFSKSPFKRAISDETLDDYKIYIQLFINTFILGLQNAIELYQSLRLKGNLAFFLTYKISQDFIETTFSAIRSRLVYNDNPTCMQFKVAYKRILVHNEAVGSIFRNCSILDNTKNLSVTEKTKDSVLTLESTWLPQQDI
ncbi:hypothetical protein QTP88_007387 [Uroleucon formosanum]